jgi:hypothetical protein
MQRKILLITCLLLFTNLGLAKELTSRLGLGFRNAYSMDLPSIAAIYYPSSDVGVVGAIGIDTKDQNSSSAFSAGIRRIIFKEENMNFFMSGVLSFLSQETAGQSDSGFELSGLVGSEFFLSGLDSLGFNIETGVGITNVKKVRFRTIGDHMFRAGIVFYF